jgi:hypothetical protein
MPSIVSCPSPPRLPTGASSTAVDPALHHPIKSIPTPTLPLKLDVTLEKIGVHLKASQLKQKKTQEEVTSIKAELDKLRGEVGRSGERIKAVGAWGTLVD